MDETAPQQLTQSGDVAPHQAFLLRLADALRPLVDANEIQSTACRLLGTYLDAARVNYAVVENGEYVVANEYHVDSLSSMAGRYPIDSFRPAERTAFESGRTVQMDDIMAVDELSAEESKAYAALGVRAFVSVPLVKNNQLVVVLSAIRSQPGPWREHEVAVIQETGERTWAAVERGRAEVALRNSEERLRLALEAAGMGSYAWYPDEDRTEADAQLLALFGLVSGELLTHAVVVSRMVHPDDRDRHRAVLAQALDPAGEGAFRDRFRVIGPDGTVRWLALSGRVQFEGDPRRAVRLTGVAWDVTAQQQAEMQLRESQERQMFLLGLSDAMRPLAEPEEIKRVAASTLGERLGANRVVYVERIQPDAGFTVFANNTAGLEPISAPFRIEDYAPEILSQLQSGHRVVQPDVISDERLQEHGRRAVPDAGVGASLSVPLIRNGSLVAFLCVNFAAAHDFSAHEMDLVVEVAERMWTALARARAELALRQSEERLGLAIEVGELSSWDWDLRSGAVTWNDRHFLMQGYGVGEVTPSFEAWIARVHPDDRQDTIESIERARDTKTTYVHQFRTQHSDGSIRWCSARGSFFYDAHGQPYRMIGLMEDVTDSKRANEALRLGEERLRTIIDSIKDYAIFTLDTAGRITSWNDGARRLKGYDADEVIGRPVTLFYTPDDVAAGKPYQELMTAMTTGRSEDESWRIRKDGSRFWVNEIMQPLRDASGASIGVVKISRDLTERKNLEDALTRARNSLEERVRERTSQVQSLFERLVSAQEEERRRIARDIHDQVGQQMTALRMNLEVLRSQAADVEPLAAQADRTQRLAEELDQSIDFLTWQLRPAALDHLGLSAALHHLVTEWSARFQIAAEFFAEDVQDVRLPRDVEANLYRIAQEALHNVAKHANASQVTVVLTQRAGRLGLVIEDNGRGFQPLADRSEEGTTGLGLISMRERAALVGGELEIDSSPDRGTAIYVSIPESAGPDERH